MLNWRIVVGLVLLIAGMGELYSVMNTPAGVKLNYSPQFIEVACMVWMAVGIFFILKGTKK